MKNIDYILFFVMIAAVIWIIIAGIIFQIHNWNTPITYSMRFHAFWKPALIVIVSAFILKARLK